MFIDHKGRAVLVGVGLLVLGAVLAIGAVKADHHLHGPPAASVAQASAGYGLQSPTSVTLVGADLYVANGGGNSVTVVNASTGAHVTTIIGPSYGFGSPSAIVTTGGDLFVANRSADTVTEIDAASHALVRIIAGFTEPIALATGDGNLYVLNAPGSVTKVSIPDGQIEASASGPQFGFSAPLGIAAAGADLFVTNSADNSVTAIDDQTMTLTSILKGSAYKFSIPTGVTVLGSNVWVANFGGDSATEMVAATGKVVRVVVDHTNLPTPGPITVGDGYVFTVSPPGVSPMVSQIEPSTGTVAWMKCNTNGPYLFSNPQSAAVYGDNLWVVSKGSSSLTQMDTDTGDLIRTIS